MFKLKDATMIYDMDKEDKVYAMREINLTLPDKGLIGIIGSKKVYYWTFMA